jgi:hypothetical protein
MRVNLELTLRKKTFSLSGENKGRCATNPQVRKFVLN